MRSTDRNLALAAIALAILLAGCAAPAPTPVISTPAATKTEEDHLKLASKEYSKALVALMGFKYKEAEQLLLEMTRKYPDFAGPYGNLGIVYMRTGRIEEAEKAFNKAIELNPNIASVHNQLGVMYRENGRFEDARKAYLRALEIDPEYPNAHLNMGILYDLYLLEYDKALNHYLRYQALKKPDKNDPVHKWIADLTNRRNSVQ